jgi:hypothetical protein
MSHRAGTLLVWSFVFTMVPLPATAIDVVRKIEFNRDVRPILSDNCFQCHGPDEKQRKADLRLDTREGLQGAAKEIIEHITTTDPELQMPPPDSGKKLSAGQIALLTQWAEQGATWSSHWAFTPPTRPPVPTFEDEKLKALIKNPIDAFVLERLVREGWTLSPEATRETLIRRASLDLTGLPPTPEKIDAFLNDTSDQAYENVVDQLLKSRRYGERMAWRWLEAARYSDTSGYQTDGDRDMWRWRDWVIDAFNDNIPFDRFTVEQIAGDMLQGATLDQRIATGFNRNHRGNAEGGIVPEEYAVEYVADRVETTATVWLGLTFTCCRCHDHKFDPFSQREFYQLFSYFNNVPEKGRAVKYGNSPPLVKAPTQKEAQKRDELKVQLLGAGMAVLNAEATLEESQAKWEQSVDSLTFADWSPEKNLANAFSMDAQLLDENPSFVHVPGRIRNAIQFDGQSFVSSDTAKFGFDHHFTLSCWVKPAKAHGTILSRMTDEPEGDGYAVALVDGKVQVHLTKRWLDDALRVETVQAVPLGEWSHITVTYDGTRLCAGTKVFINGRPAETKFLLDELNQTFESKEPLRIGAGGGPDARFHGLIDDVRIYNADLDNETIRVLAVVESPREILNTPSAKRTGEQLAKLRAFYLATAAPQEVTQAYALRDRLRAELRAFEDSISTVMVMEEMPEPRQAHILLRGEYDKKGEAVSPGVPTTLPKLAEGLPNNRLGLARWLVDRQNPLTARVAVNRMWQMHFGTGLVKTSEDFGTQGAFPTHPELLDWLAAEFMTDWDIKRLHKLIVTSATYRQSSQVTAETLARDPENKLLSHYPRRRLSAEMVRDQALFASGLMTEKIGGPSVKPYQPPGLWNELTGTGDYIPDTGENLYRRSLYTFWKRTAPPPVLATFDAPGRDTCWVRESRTNTPLQALTLLNETAFVEAARILAERVMFDAKTPEDRLALAFRRLTARQPSAKELAVLKADLEFQLAEFARDPDAATKLLAIGEAQPSDKYPPTEIAAYATVCNLLMNLDEVLTKE